MGALAPNWMQAVAQSVSLLTVREKSVTDLRAFCDDDARRLIFSAQISSHSAKSRFTLFLARNKWWPKFVQSGRKRKKERKKEDERKLFKFFNESVPCGRLGWSAPISPRRFSCALRFGIFLHLLLLLLFKLNKLPRPSDVIAVTFDRPDSTRTDVMEWKPA